MIWPVSASRTHGAPGYVDDQGFSPLAGHFPAHAVDTCLSSVLSLIAEVQQGGHIVVDPQDDAAAVTAVTAVRAAGCHIFFPVEGHGTIAAATAADCNSNFIYKHLISSYGEGVVSTVINECSV